VNDVFDYFRLNYSLDQVAASETSSEGTRKKRPVKQDLYKTLKSAEGIAELAKVYLVAVNTIVLYSKCNFI